MEWAFPMGWEIPMEEGPAMGWEGSVSITLAEDGSAAAAASVVSDMLWEGCIEDVAMETGIICSRWWATWGAVARVLLLSSTCGEKKWLSMWLSPEFVSFNFPINIFLSFLIR